MAIKHRDIPRFMPGMTMPFKVRDRRLLSGRRPGDLITATLVVEDTDAWLATLEKTGTAPLPDTPPPPTPAAGVGLLSPGLPAPETRLIDQDGQSLSLADWRGSVVAVTFIYTSCPLPQFCPMMDRRFAEVQRLVRADASLAGRVRLLSVSFDPDVDTPAALGAHAAVLGADSAIWRFATASAPEIDRFAASFGVNVIRETDRTITHNLRTAVIGPDGRVAAIYDGSVWTAGELVAELRSARARSAS